MLVCCTTEESGFSSCRLAEVTSIVANCSCFCSMLVSVVRLRKLVFFQLPKVEIFHVLWLMFLPCLPSMLVTCNLYDSLFQLPLPRSENLKYWCDFSVTLFICLDRPARRISLFFFLFSNVSTCLVLFSGSLLFYCNCETCKTGFAGLWITVMRKIEF